MSLRCENCGRFISPETCLEGWSGGLFGDYNNRFYCAAETGCNRTTDESLIRLPGSVVGVLSWGEAHTEAGQ